MIENPPLNEDLLIHFGVKGMRWGRRKARADEGDRKKTFGANAERNKKIAIGVAAVGGALVVGALLTKSGRNKVTDMAVTNYVQQRQARATAGQNPFGKLARKFQSVKAASVPSPDKLIADSRMAAVRNRVAREGNQRLTEKAWRDQAKISRLTRDMDKTTNSLLGGGGKIPSLDQIRARLNDPNYVWDL